MCGRNKAIVIPKPSQERVQNACEGHVQGRELGEDPFDQQDSGPRLTRAHVRKSFSGDLVGTGNLLYLMTHASETEATFVGIERVVGSLGGRSGSFVLQHSGTFDGQKATAEWEVLQGSGTDELEGLTGSGGFSSGHAEEYEMTLEYDFEAASG